MSNPHGPQGSIEEASLQMAVTPPTEQHYRAGLYGLLGALMRSAPDEGTLRHTAALAPDVDREHAELALAMNMLALAARHSTPMALREEYHDLFIGLGRGELVPYGSWYQTGFLMEKPLGLLRNDLRRLGFERADDVHEPEDHIAALCEVMALLILDDTPLNEQQAFFDTHIGSWASGFFADLAKAESAVFYRSVARLGTAFIAVEKSYLSLTN